MHKIMTVFGIRPDFIRASVLLKNLAARPDVELQFVYTGQHYDENLKDVFFKELGIPEPDYNLDTRAGSHSQQHAKLISQLDYVIRSAKPDVVVFLGDANAVIGCIAPLKMGVPIAHIEAGMRSYDWRMPEERNRVIVDRVSDVLYCYQEDYKYRLIQEGVCPTKIVVTGNTIVDVIHENLSDIIGRSRAVLDRFNLEPQEYGVMTMHRHENMNQDVALELLNKVNDYAKFRNFKVILPVMPRLRMFLLRPLSNFIYTEPLGFLDFVALERMAKIEFTDSGTNQETSAILGTPCVVLRRSTERPETFKSNITVMETDKIHEAADSVMWAEKNKDFSLGNGDAAEIIIDDLVARLENDFGRKSPPIDNFIAQNWKTWSSK